MALFSIMDTKGAMEERRARSLSPEKIPPIRNQAAQCGWTSDSPARNMSHDNFDDMRSTIVPKGDLIRRTGSGHIWSPLDSSMVKEPNGIEDFWGLSIKASLNEFDVNSIRILQKPGATRLQRLLNFYLDPEFVVLPEGEKLFKDKMLKTYEDLFN